jgi:hypothetical protein
VRTQVNTVLESCGSDVPLVDPVLGNVCFSSAAGGWSFTLTSFAKLYTDVHNIPVDVNEFARRLWGYAFHRYTPSPSLGTHPLSAFRCAM